MVRRLWRFVRFVAIFIISNEKCHYDFFAESCDSSLCSHSYISETRLVYKSTQGEIKHRNEVGLIRYHYDAAVASCHYVILIGVGTFMSVKDYDKIATTIASDHPIVVAITDHNVDNFEKTSAPKYAALVNEITSELVDLVPICHEHEAQILIGGHSASGQAAMQAWQQNLIDQSMLNLVGFVGLDPYEISAKTMDERALFDLSGLYWGLSETTCLVSVEKAAEAAYKLTNNSARVLYTLHNKNEERDMTHCVFADHGCGFRPFTCGGYHDFDWVHDSVANSIHLYLQALANVIPFDRDSFRLPRESDRFIDVRVNEGLKVSAQTKNRTGALRSSVN